MSSGAGPPGAGGPGTEGPGEPREPAEPEGVERWLRPFFAESTLWPVLVAAAGIGATCLAALLLLARQGSLFALVALAGVLWISVDAAWRERQARGRLGLLGRSLLGLWLLGGVAAVAAVRLGLF